ncbi:hypothetical protein ACXXDK_13700 [Deinococcus sp. PESE-38]
MAAFGAALHAELGLGEEGRLEGAEVPRLLKLQAALDEQEARFARSADQQSLELAPTHAARRRWGHGRRRTESGLCRRVRPGTGARRPAPAAQPTGKGSVHPPQRSPCGGPCFGSPGGPSGKTWPGPGARSRA